MKPMRTIFTHAKVYTEGRFVETTLTIEGDRIVALGEEPTGEEREIDLKGRYLVPGLVDVHVHLALNVCQIPAAFEVGKNVEK